MTAKIDRQLRQILADVLGLDARAVAAFDTDTGLFGHLPELDSLSVAGLLTEMEDRLGSKPTARCSPSPRRSWPVPAPAPEPQRAAAC